MAVEKMKMMSLIALKKDAHDILERIILNGTVHIGNNQNSSNFTLGYLQGNKQYLLDAGVDINRIRAFKSERTFERKKFKDLIDRLFLFIGIDEEELKNADMSKMNISEHLKELDNLDQQASTIRNYEMANEYAIEKTETQVRVVEYFSQSSIDLTQLSKLDFFDVHVGEISRNSWVKLKNNYENIKAIVVHLGRTSTGEAVMIFAPKMFYDETKSLLMSLSFDQVDLPDAPMSAQALLELKKKEIDGLYKQKDRVAKAKEVFIDMYRASVVALYFRYKMIEKIEYLESHVAESGNFFIFNAFVPASTTEKLKQDIEKMADNAIVAFEDDSTVPKKFTIPTKLMNNVLLRPFETLVKMYSVPQYQESDPTPFFALTYMLLFGLMFGDVGQGIVLILAGTLLKKQFGSLSGIIQRIGVSSTIFGFIYGSVFGMEDLIPALIIRPMEQINTILIFAIVLGVALVSIAYFMGFYNLKKKGRYADLYFDKNGISGFLFYISFLLFIFNMVLGQSYFGSISSLVTMITTAVMVITTCLMILKLKLKPRVEKANSDDKEEFSAVESGFEMFETIMSFFSNTLSFIRVGAFAINHVGLFMAFHALGQMIGNTAGNIFMIIVGNIVILSLEALIVFIQAIRLEYYELFSKYFEGGGEIYSPLTFDIKAK